MALRGGSKYLIFLNRENRREGEKRRGEEEEEEEEEKKKRSQAQKVWKLRVFVRILVYMTLV